MPKSHPTKLLPSQDYLRACFDYNPETGTLTWKYRPREHFASKRTCAERNGRFAGRPAGSPHKRGYSVIRLNATAYLAHRIIWKWITGEEPPNSPDHKDRDPSNNRWANLRPATRTEQNWNRKTPKNNTSGFRGVYPQKTGKYIARIARCYLGTFATAEAAAAAYDIAARQRCGKFMP